MMRKDSIRNRLTLAVISVVLILTQIDKVYATDNYVEVYIPSFSVEINEESIDTASLKYPLIVSNNITYFPLTWNWCTELGLVSGFTIEDGLYVANYTSYNESNPVIMDYSGDFNVGEVYSASIPSYPIHINGLLIDNNSEEYPLLNFQGVTYFPLTWRFVSDVFGWDETWDDVEGFALSSEGILQEYGPGEEYESSYLYTLEEYKEYSIIEKVTTYWSMGTEANEYGDYGHYNNGSISTYYNLDYKDDSLITVDSEVVSDTPYNSGDTSFYDVSSEFEMYDNIFYHDESKVLDLSEELLEGKEVTNFWIDKYSCNGMDIYDVTVVFTEDGNVIPAPYTPRKSYVLLTSGNEKIMKLESWPVYRELSSVFPSESEGVFLCASGRYFGSSRYNNGQGFVMEYKSDMSERILNDIWDDWNSVTALGMDNEGSLYLRNTWFPEYEFANQYNGSVSLINDGYFKLDSSGNLSKIYPFVEAEHITVTPSGNIYIDAGWTDSIIHLQTDEYISPD